MLLGVSIKVFAPLYLDYVSAREVITRRVQLHCDIGCVAAAFVADFVVDDRLSDEVKDEGREGKLFE
jgi:hypothetical protein